MPLTPAQKQRRYRERKAGVLRSPSAPEATSPARGPSVPDPIATQLEANVVRLAKQVATLAKRKSSTVQDRAVVDREYRQALSQLSQYRLDQEPSPGRIVKMSSFAAVLDVFDRVAQEHPGPWVKALREGLAALP